MKNKLKNISFDREKSPGLGFDIFSLKQFYNRKDLDHSPLHLHRIDFYLLIFITSGQGKHTIDFNDYDFKPGTVMTIRKDQVHRFHQHSASGFLLLFTEEFVISHLDQSSVNKIQELFNELFFQQLTTLSKEELVEYLSIVELIKKEFNGVFDNHTSGIIRNLLQILLSKIHRKRNVFEQFEKDNKYVQQFLKLQALVESMCITSRSVQFYASQLNTTSRTLNNITQRIINKSCKTFIDEILILQIKRQLINSTLTIKGIAYNVGFEEPSNMFKFFKRYARQTPQQFREEYALG